MADVAVSAQLQQWSFEKSRPERADSSASSPRLDQAEIETLKIEDAAMVQSAPSPDSKDTIVLQQCYLSSEEDLSTVEGDSSDSECDDVEVLSIHDGSEKEGFAARKMSMARFDKGTSCDLAVQVSYMSAGRPKVIDLATVGSPTRETPPQRSASLAALPTAAISKLKHLAQGSRMSLAAPPSSTTSRSTSPAGDPELRRPSTSNARFSHNNSSLRVSDSSSFTNSSTRSSSPAVSERSTRPASVAASRPSLQPTRSSLFISSSASQTRPFAPLTPISPNSPAPSFLSSDPYESTTTSAASPILKSSPHRRLRSISQKLALAKIAITPSTKKWDSRVNGRANNMPPTPATPFTPRTPMTPQTAPPTGSAPPNRLRRNSRFSRPSSVRGPSPDNIPALPTRNAPSQPSNYPIQKLVPRGANEREPTLELPPCPDDAFDTETIASMSKAKKIRKRKSLMDLLVQ